MLRFLLILATIVCAIHCNTSNAQTRRGTGHIADRNPSYYRGPRHHRFPYQPSLFGFSIGIGNPDYRNPNFRYVSPYAYDPYRYGSFRAPDLLDDPGFRERHRYDSQFPGRRRRPLVVRPAGP